MALDLKLNVSPWQYGWESTSRDIDREFGEQFLVITVIDPKPNYAPEVDRSMPIYTMWGVFSNRYYTGLKLSNNNGSAVAVESSRPYLDIAVVNTEHSIGQYDRIFRPRTKLMYEITKTVPDGTRVRCGFWLKELGLAEDPTHIDLDIDNVPEGLRNRVIKQSWGG